MRTTEPKTIKQGESIEWTRSFSGYSAEDYDVEYRFRGAGPGADVVCTADESAFVAALTSDQTSKMEPGKYEWQAWVMDVDASIAFVVDSGTTTVEKGFVSDETGDMDLRSDAKKIVDAIDEALLNAAGSGGVVEYEITTPAGSRRVKTDRAQALETRKYYADIVARENQAERIRNGDQVGKRLKGVFWEI